MHIISPTLNHVYKVRSRRLVGGCNLLAEQQSFVAGLGRRDDRQRRDSQHAGSLHLSSQQ